MKIKGVTGGKNKGNPVEFSPSEKPLVVLKAELPKKAPEGESWWVQSASITSSQHTPLENESAKKKFANNSYIAEGEVSISRLKVAGDKYLKPITKKFKLEFRDITDSMGMPDMELETLDLI